MHKVKANYNCKKTFWINRMAINKITGIHKKKAWTQEVVEQLPEVTLPCVMHTKREETERVVDFTLIKTFNLCIFQK